ncbi:hypothetical protein EV702DRAFT_665831 [Suillus placidus]|uniref:Uncharacterized protein n=1 Tax=Suillus placidus TaxID=48579 RepID=A0A9P6ZL92_9AGAM|nr:hypothetical protein EV702DRAFT_665831 [Suillus placidus]
MVFPGGFLPTLTLLLKSMEKSTGGRLTVDSVSNIGPHYARTLREWRRRFVSRFESVIVPALKAEHPAIINGPEEGKRYRSSAENGYVGGALFGLKNLTDIV